MTWIIYIICAGAAIMVDSYKTADDAAIVTAWLMAAGHKVEVIPPDEPLDLTAKA